MVLPTMYIDWKVLKNHGYARAVSCESSTQGLAVFSLLVLVHELLENRIEELFQNDDHLTCWKKREEALELEGIEEWDNRGL